jgi:hypothetical protein
MDKELLSSLRELLREELQPIKSQVEENTLLLKAIEHKVDILSAEQENLKHEVAEIKGE